MRILISQSAGVKKDRVPAKGAPKKTRMSDAELKKALTDASEDDNGKVIMTLVESATDEQLTKLMGGKGLPDFGHILFPSMWGSITNAPYPERLAKILVTLPKSKESVTDLMNEYYGRDRKLTPGARAVFMKDVLSLDPKKLAHDLLTGSSNGDAFAIIKRLAAGTPKGYEEIATPPGLVKYAKADAANLKKMFLKLPKDILELLPKLQDIGAGPEFQKILKKIGVV